MGFNTRTTFPMREVHSQFLRKATKNMHHERGNEPVVDMYCYWAWEFDILNEKVLRVSIFQDATRITLQVLVLNTIDEDHLEEISIAHTNFIAQLCNIYVCEEYIIRVADASEVAKHEPLPLKVYKRSSSY